MPGAVLSHNTIQSVPQAKWRVLLLFVARFVSAKMRGLSVRPVEIGFPSVKAVLTVDLDESTVLVRVQAESLPDPIPNAIRTVLCYFCGRCLFGYSPPANLHHCRHPTPTRSPLGLSVPGGPRQPDTGPPCTPQHAVITGYLGLSLDPVSFPPAHRSTATLRVESKIKCLLIFFERGHDIWW